MEFNYYYGSQADQFSFIRIPKVMLTEELFFDTGKGAVWGTSGSYDAIPEECLVR